MKVGDTIRSKAGVSGTAKVVSMWNEGGVRLFMTERGFCGVVDYFEVVPSSVWKEGDKFRVVGDDLGRVYTVLLVEDNGEWLNFRQEDGILSCCRIGHVIPVVDVPEDNVRMFIRLDEGQCICGIAKVSCRYHGGT